jgi:hypothetical protein
LLCCYGEVILLVLGCDLSMQASLLLVPEAEVAAASAAAAAGARPLSGNSDTGTVLITGNDDDDCSGSEDDDDIEGERLSFPTCSSHDVPVLFKAHITTWKEAAGSRL